MGPILIVRSLWPPLGTKVESVRFITTAQNNVIHIDAADMIPLDSISLPQDLVVDNRQAFFRDFTP